MHIFVYKPNPLRQSQMQHSTSKLYYPQAPVPDIQIQHTSELTDTQIQDAKTTLMSPHKLRIFVCDSSGACSFSEGIPSKLKDAIQQPLYVSLLHEPLAIRDTVKRPECYCEYILLTDTSITTPPNSVYKRLRGTLFVLKYVTSKPSQNRIQIEVAQYDKDAILKALTTKFA